MKQRVKNISYLAKVVVPLNELVANQPKELIFVPRGAEVLHIDCSVKEAGDAGAQLDIGLNSENSYFANDLTLNSTTYHNIATGASVQGTSTITATINQASTKGSIVLRVHYFLPSEYEMEV